MPIAQFTILNHLEKLTILETGTTEYTCECPVCGGDRLTINKESGANQCWHGCECKDIREAIAPWNQVQQSQAVPREKRLRPLRLERLDSQLQPPFTLAMLPGLATDSPKPQLRLDREGKEVQVTQYVYSPAQWVERTEWKDESHPKGHQKRFTPWHKGNEGQSLAQKGERPWPAYRLEEALQAAEASQANAVMMVEGEKAVETYRQLGLACITLQGSDWGKEALPRLVAAMKAKQLHLVYHPDHDAPGQKKAQKLQSACIHVKVRCLVLDPLAIDPALPVAGDIADIVSAGMSREEISSRIEAEIKRQLERSASIAEAPLTIPDTFAPDVEFNQQVFKILYADVPWICVDEELYQWTGTYYKKSPPGDESRRVWHICNSYPVTKKGEIRYPYANPSKVNAALEWVKLGLSVNPALINPAGINCTNGVLQVHWDGSSPRSVLMPHSSALY